MFSARQGFFANTPTNWGNNIFFPGDEEPNATYISSPTTTFDLVNWKATTGYTIEYWGFWERFDTGNSFSGFGQHADANTNFWSFGPFGATPFDLGRLQFSYFDPLDSGSFNTAPGTIPLNTWVNICAVFTTTSGTTTANLYINGIRQDIQYKGTGAYLPQQTTTSGFVSTQVSSFPFAAGYKYSVGDAGRNLAYFNNIRASNVNRYNGSVYLLASESFANDADTQILIRPTGVPGTTIPYTGVFSGNMFNNPATPNRATVTTTRANHT